jgi:hypothetical protein
MKTNNLKKSVLTLFSVAALFAMSFFTGCSEDSITSSTTTNGNGSGDKSLSISALNDDNSPSNPANVIIITEAKALINEVELEKEPSGTEQEVHIAPFVIHFDINGGMSEITSANLPAGSYSKIKFKLHKPEDNETPSDPEFKDGESGNQRYSFIIKGSFNGIPFVYKSSKSASLVINLNSTINLQNAGNITMLFSKLSWFRNGNDDLDPRDHQNDDLIDDHIKNSFSKAFRDDDKNGREDH